MLNPHHNPTCPPSFFLLGVKMKNQDVEWNFKTKSSLSNQSQIDNAHEDSPMCLCEISVFNCYH